MLPATENNAKILLIGKSGAGKTGSIASLVSTGLYKVRILDTDKGVRSLVSLLKDERYPYAAVCKKNGVDINEVVDVFTIDQKMRAAGGEIKPADARGWTQAANAIGKWTHDDIEYGNVGDWDSDTVFILDSFSTLAKMAYYAVQALNSRLGGPDSGRNYQRDIGGAQSNLQRLLELLYCDSVKCNVVIISHITWVDDSRGYSASPESMVDKGETPDPDGYPAAIGRALSPQIGKYFNDVFTVKSSGSGTAVRRRIHTTPIDGVICKNSTFLKPEYDIKTGLAEIFAEMRRQPLPDGFLDAFKTGGSKP